MSSKQAQEHQRVADLLSAYIDGELASPDQALVESHLERCDECLHELTTLRQTVNLLRELPSVPASRSFTLSEADVASPRQQAGPARSWWQSLLVPGLVGSAATLMCVVAVLGVFLLNGGLGAMPGFGPRVPQIAYETASEPEETGHAVEKAAAPAPAEELAEAAVTPTAAAQEVPLGIEAELDESGGGDLAAASKSTDESIAAMENEAIEQPEIEALLADESRAADSAAEEMMDGEASGLAKESAPESAEPEPPLAPAEALEGAAWATAPAPTATAVPTPAPLPSNTPVALLLVSDLSIEIEPGLIVVEGKLPLPEGQPLQAELWRGNQRLVWAVPESRRTEMGPARLFVLRLEALPGIPGRDLFRIAPAQYEIRIRPVDPSIPVEARIVFDTYSPPNE